MIKAFYFYYPSSSLLNKFCDISRSLIHDFSEQTNIFPSQKLIFFRCFEKELVGIRYTVKICTTD